MCQLNLPHGSGKWGMRPSVEKSGGRPPPAPLHPCMMCIQYTDWLETSSPSRMSSSVIAMLNDALYAAPATELALLHALAPAASTFLYCRSKYDSQRSLVYHTDHPPLYTARCALNSASCGSVCTRCVCFNLPLPPSSTTRDRSRYSSSFIRIKITETCRTQRLPFKQHP